MKALTFIRTGILVAGLWAQQAWAQEWRLGVLLPQAALGSNAERSAWAETLGQQLGKALGKEGSVRTQVFARLGDAQAFASQLDVLLTDGLSFVELKQGEVIAHTKATKVGLFVSKPSTLEALKGAKVGLVEASQASERYWANTVFGGELELEFFGEKRAFKDLASAVAALKAGEISALLAPESPATQGLQSVAQGGPYLGALWVVLSPKAKTESADLAKAIVSLPAQHLGGFQMGAGEAAKSLQALWRMPAVVDAPAVLTPWNLRDYPAPSLRLEGDKALPQPKVEPKASGAPPLPEIF